MPPPSDAIIGWVGRWKKGGRSPSTRCLIHSLLLVTRQRPSRLPIKKAGKIIIQKKIPTNYLVALTTAAVETNHYPPPDQSSLAWT